MEGDAMTVLADSWSLGVLIGLPALVLIIAICLLFAWFGFSDGETTIGVCAVLALLVTLIGGLAFFWPLHAEYHKWETTDGTIESIAKRIVGGDKISEKFVVRYTDGRERGCLDTRCSLLKAGDKLTLTCKRSWQYAGTDGYDCNYIASSRDRS